MMKNRSFILTLLLAAGIFISLTVPGEALYKNRREINITYDTVFNAGYCSNITLSWIYANGDTLHKSWDGKSWSQISFTAPTPGQKVTVESATYVPFYSVIYFELRDSTYADANRDVTDKDTKPLFTTVVAYPPNTNAHAELSNNTQWCASCHVTHAADGPFLMKAPTRSALCMTCHDGSASRYNVVGGTVRLRDGTYAKASGGAFVGRDPAWNDRPTTSTHVYSYSETGYAPGFDTPSKVWNDVDCNNCHSTHADRSSYRMLKTIDDLQNPNQNFGNNIYAWVYNPDGMGETTWYENVDGLNCNFCHSEYNTTKGNNNGLYPVFNQFSQNFSVNHYIYRHDTNSSILGYTDRDGNITDLNPTLPVITDVPTNSDDPVNVKKLMCLTCHYPHGTTAVGSEKSSFDRNMSNNLDDDTSTMLKRLDYYGVCENCHQK